MQDVIQSGQAGAEVWQSDILAGGWALQHIPHFFLVKFSESLLQFFLQLYFVNVFLLRPEKPFSRVGMVLLPWQKS